MLILIEGVDGSGKTSLAETICAEYGASYIHSGAPERHPIIEYTVPLEHYVPNSGEHIVCDRWHLGEWVYGPLFRGRTDMTLAGFNAIEEFLVLRAAVLVFCTTDGRHGINEFRERLLARDGEAPTHNELWEQDDSFRGIVRQSSLTTSWSRYGREISPHAVVASAMEEESRLARV